MAQSFNYNDINNLYKTNLGRDASQDEFQGWQSGSYGDNPFSQIPNSGEAQGYKAMQSAGNAAGLTKSPFTGTAPTGGSRTDPTYVRSVIDYYANQPGANPSLKNDPDYWARQIGGGHLGDDQGYWVQKFMTPEGAPVGAGGGGAGGGASNGWLSGGGSGFTSSMGGIDSGAGSTLFKTLMDRAGQSINVSPNDPVIRQQTDAYAAAQERGNRNTMAQLAEKAGANSNLTAETRAAGEAAGQNTGQFEGQLMSNEIAARRQEIQQALSGAAGLLTQEQSMQLQEELHQLDLAQNQSQFNTTMGQRGYEFDATRGDRVAGAY